MFNLKWILFNIPWKNFKIAMQWENCQVSVIAKDKWIQRLQSESFNK